MWDRVDFVCCIATLLIISQCWACEDHADILQKLSEQTSNEQFKESKPYQDLVHMQETAGVYRSYAFYNAHGSEEYAVLRRDLQMLDNSVFQSGFVGPQILDAYRFGNAPMPPRDDIMRIVKLFASNHNKNLGYNNSMESFYEQMYNPTTGTWQAISINMQSMLKGVDFPKELLPFGFDFSIGSEETPDGLIDFIAPTTLVSRFALSADFDTSSLNILLGAILSEVRGDYPEEWAFWRDTNTNLTSVFDRLKVTAYRPFSGDRSVNTIDTRSYYSMREFLEQRKNDGKDVALVPCWDLDIATEKAFGTAYGTLTPGTNFIEAGILANFISSVFVGLDAGLIDHDLFTQDEDLKHGGSSSLRCQTNFNGRSDLVIMSYAYEYEFFWLVSRGLFYMENAKLGGTLQDIPVFETYYNGISDAMRTAATSRLLNDRKFDEDEAVFYDEFLGNADVSFDGTPINRAEDRYYVTATVANSLIYTWSVYDREAGSVRWVDSVPEEVKSTVYGISRWLVKNPFGGKHGVTSVVYCGGVANRETFPFWYPANRYEFFNGTKIPNFDRIEPGDIIFGMEGHVTPEEYQKLLDVDQFGVKTPKEFHGRNSGQGTAIYWKVDAVSYGSAMMALSMTNALQKSENYVCADV